MATTTTNFGLIKPGQEEFYNVDVSNSNMDTIDELLKALQDAISSGASEQDLKVLRDALAKHLVDNEKHVTPTDRTNWDGKASAIHTHTIAQVNGLQKVLDSKIDNSAGTPTAISLPRGATTIVAERVTPLKVLGFNGRTTDLKGVIDPTLTNVTKGDSIKFLGTFYEGERVAVEEGRATFLRKKRYMVLNGTLPWEFHSSATGFKVVKLKLSDFAQDSQQIVRYDGKLIETVLVANQANFNKVDQSLLQASDGYLYLTIPNENNGWSDAYTPTTKDLETYFYGLKPLPSSTSAPTAFMYLDSRLNILSGVNTTSTQTYVVPVTNVANFKVGDTVLIQSGGATGGFVTRTVISIGTNQIHLNASVVTNGNGYVYNLTGLVEGVDYGLDYTAVKVPNYQSYRLLHDLATPNAQNVETIGAINLAEGDNLLELTEDSAGAQTQPFDVEYYTTIGGVVNELVANNKDLQKRKNQPGGFLELDKNGYLPAGTLQGELRKLLEFDVGGQATFSLPNLSNYEDFEIILKDLVGNRPSASTVTFQITTNDDVPSLGQINGTKTSNQSIGAFNTSGVAATSNLTAFQAAGPAGPFIINARLRFKKLGYNSWHVTGVVTVLRDYPTGLNSMTNTDHILASFGGPTAQLNRITFKTVDNIPMDSGRAELWVTV